MQENQLIRQNTERRLKKGGYVPVETDNLGGVYYAKGNNLIYVDDIGIFHYLLVNGQRIRQYGRCFANIDWSEIF